MRYCGLNIFGYTGEDPSKELYGFPQYDITMKSYKFFSRIAAKNYDTIVTEDNYQYAIKQGKEIGEQYEDHLTGIYTGKSMYMCQILFTENHPYFNLVDLIEFDKSPLVGDIAIKWEQAMYKAIGTFMKGKLP